MFIEDRPLWSWKTPAPFEPVASCRGESPFIFLLCLLTLHFGHEPESLMFVTLMLEFSTSPFVFYHSMFYLSLSIYTLSSVAGVVRRRRLHAWRSGESRLPTGWQSVGMLSLPHHPEISGEGTGFRPQQPTNKSGFGSCPLHSSAL